MLKIILCDDDRFILNLAKGKIEEAILKYRLNASIVCIATNGGEIFQYIKQNMDAYLIFLDLDFGSGKLNGIDIAKQIKALQEKCKIVFATNHQEMAMKVLNSGVEPFGFLEKSTNMSELTNGYLRYIQMAASVLENNVSQDESISLTVGIDETVTLQKGQILYVESEKTISHGVTYHTMDGSFITVRDTMEHVLSQFGEDFIRVHRSIIANKKHIIGLDNANIHLSNGQDIPCAIRMRNEVKKCME